MGDNTGIEWTDATWNPVVGCSIATPGYTNCYAMKMAGRLEAMAVAEEVKTGDPGSMRHYMGTTQMTKAGSVWTGQVNVAPDSIFLKPLSWTRPRRIFVNSMSDLFHPTVPQAVQDRAFAVMALAQRHVFQLLTKRSDIQRAYLSDPETPGRIAAQVAQLQKPGTVVSVDWPLPNVWAGVSVEDQTRAELRLVDLGNTPAAIRWVSAEPLSGEVDFRNVRVENGLWLDALTGFWRTSNLTRRLPQILEPIDWIVAGGESGPGARPMPERAAAAIRDQTSLTGTAFLFKQWGDWFPTSQADYLVGMQLPNTAAYIKGDHPFFAVRIGKHKAGRLLDGRTHDGYPA